MGKRTSTGKAKKTPQVKRVHYIVVVLSSIVLAVLVTVVLLPVKNSGVLSAKSIAGNEVGSEPNLTQNGEIHGRGNGGANATTRGKGKPASVIEKLKQKFQSRMENKASESGDEENDENEDDSTASSESGKPKNQHKGKTKILILPEKAVAALLRNGIIQQVASNSGSASSGAQVVYTRTNGKPVYIVAGTKKQKLFGAIPVTTDKTVTVSAESGEVVSTKQSLASKILELLSF